jgi:molybdenum cofactor guanylyltransferase
MEGPRSTAGFVLTGGRSSRMGRDKALLEIEGATLAGRIAARVRDAAGNATLIGGPGLGAAEKYASLGFPVLADLVEDAGPLGGILTALTSTHAGWNLIVACDMPAVTTEFLSGLLQAAIAGDHACLAPETPDGIHPLCAVYHRRALPAVRHAIDHKCFKMQDFLKTIGAVSWPVADAAILQNANTPAEWAAR